MPAIADSARAIGLATFDIDGVPAAAPTWPPPEIPVDHVAANLHTSGSTGASTRHAKTWGELVHGAETLMRTFGSPEPDSGLLGTVAPQHMFGFETTILLALQSGAPLLPGSPSLPADLGRALREARELGRERVWLFTTPLQLRAFHAGRSVEGLARVITATMPLDRSLAQAVERDWHVPVEEIYGCTEGGMLACRRPTRGETFSAGTGLRFAIDAEDRATVAGGHLPTTVVLADRIELVEPISVSGPQQFRLLGREDDLVKIGGKRASLAGLTAALKSLPGMQDAVFFLPSPGARRLCAAVVAPYRSAADVQRSLAAVIDPAFHPRPLLVVEHLPRGAGQKVSLASLRGLVVAQHANGAAAISDAAEFSARSIFRADDPVFAGHFPGRPIVPGVLLLEWVEAALAARGYRVRECRSVKFHATAGPEQALDVVIALSSPDVARFEVRRATTLIASGSCRCDAISNG
jgi:acyl-coenzyme A synthetase/AMP-(fatty) acid ligase